MSTPASRVKVGVIGAGLIAQVMHLNYLRELSDRFEVAAICDIVAENAAASAERYGIAATFTDWRELLAQPLDAVLVLTAGSHAPMAIEAAGAGIHVLVEKPMCFSTAEAAAMVDAADAGGVILMVAYNKRYDPAYLRFRDEVASLEDQRFLRVTTLESPIAPYVTHYPLAPVRRPPDEIIAQLQTESTASIVAALGDADEGLRTAYHMVLLDTLVHEINALRGLLGEPDSLDHVELRGTRSLSLSLRFGDLPVGLDWIDLPGIARYRMEFALYAPQRRVTLAFPSPFLRSEPTMIEIEEGEPGTAGTIVSQQVTSYESSFKRELIAFHESILSGTPPVTSGRDSAHDIALCQAIIECARSGQRVDHPTRVTSQA